MKALAVAGAVKNLLKDVREVLTLIMDSISSLEKSWYRERPQWAMNRLQWFLSVQWFPWGLLQHLRALLRYCDISGDDNDIIYKRKDFLDVLKGVLKRAGDCRCLQLYLCSRYLDKQLTIPQRQEQLMAQRSLALELQVWEPTGPISS